MAESELFSDILYIDHNFSFSVHSTAVVGALQFYSPVPLFTKFHDSNFPCASFR